MGTNIPWCWQSIHSLTAQAKGPHFSSFGFLFPNVTKQLFSSETFCQTPSVVDKVSVVRKTQNCSDACFWTCTCSQFSSDSHSHQDACYTLCSIILLSRGLELPVKRGAQGRAGAWRDQSTISPMASLDTDFKLHTSPWNITPISIHFCSSITNSLTFNHSHPILYLLFPACLERLGRQRADWILKG